MLSNRHLMTSKALQLQLINLGRIIENPNLIDRFEPEDFADYDLKRLIASLKSNLPKNMKDDLLKEFMKSVGCSVWKLPADRATHIEESQKRQAYEIAFNRATKKASKERNPKIAIRIMDEFSATYKRPDSLESPVDPA